MTVDDFGPDPIGTVQALTDASGFVPPLPEKHAVRIVTDVSADLADRLATVVTQHGGHARVSVTPN